MSERRILVVGGDPDIARTLQVYLEAHKFSAQLAKRGDEALTACHQSPPEAVIFNWRLPDMDGQHLCQQMRADERVRHTFILALLSTGQRDERLAALEAGADDVMALPLDMEQIRLRIEQALRP
jgi:DNA-binding response OmpR family regulator